MEALPSPQGEHHQQRPLGPSGPELWLPLPHSLRQEMERALSGTDQGCWAGSKPLRAAGPAPVARKAVGTTAFLRCPAVLYLITWRNDRPLMAAVLLQPVFQPI